MKSWTDDAACKGYDVSQFFPELRPGERKRPAVLEVCYGCPVKNECLEEAIRNREKGVWGGTTELDRKRASRRARDAKRRARDRAWGRL